MKSKKSFDRERFVSRLETLSEMVAAGIPLLRGRDLAFRPYLVGDPDEVERLFGRHSRLSSAARSSCIQAKDTI